MTQAVLRLALRSIAIAIAIVALIDPVWSSNRPPDRRLIAIRAAAADTSRVEAALRDQLRGWTVTGRGMTGDRLPCAPSEHCVVIADGTIDVDVPADVTRTPSLITIRTGGGPNVEVRSAQVSLGHQSAAGAARVALAGRQVKGRKTDLRVFDGTAIVGAVTHEWADAADAIVDVAWWPIGTGARKLRIEAVPAADETSTADNAIDVGVAIGSERAPVLVFDARPSWSSTFVRRALEDDPRFAVEHRARIAPSLDAGTTRGRLDAVALDHAAVVIVGGPDALTPADIALLNRFARVRGGTLVLLPERRPAEAMASIFPGTWAEHLVAQPERLGPLQATEVLQLRSPLPAATVLGQSGSVPAIVSAPAGDGRIVISGAMDAWRYRSLAENAFDRFWRSLVAEGAAAGAGLWVAFDRDLAIRGSRPQVTLRHRSMTPATTIEASAVLSCGDGPARSVRVWPTGSLGTFTGEVPIDAIGSCIVEATVGDRRATSSIAAGDSQARGVAATLDKLERSAAASGAVVASAGNEAAVARAIAAAAVESSQVVSIHPMRTGWWILPFAACLSVEWWLRRRAGLR